MKHLFSLILTVLLVFSSCQKKVSKNPEMVPGEDSIACHSVSKASLLGANDLNPTFLASLENIKEDSTKAKDFTDMVKIPTGEFDMGGDIPSGFENMPKTALPQGDELPKHPVKIDAFYMDVHEVTNAEFAEFVNATGYITIAESPINWEEIKKQLPPNTPKPPEENLKPSSLVFNYAVKGTPKDNLGNWWSFKAGVNWQHPYGPESTIIGKENHPVTHITWYDALAYCKWAGKRLPTEAEYEYAMRGGKQNAMYPWGNEKTDQDKHYANHLQGEFPYTNTLDDGFERTAPVKSFPANGYGLYDIAGNVWEWTNDWYSAKYYYDLEQTGGLADNPKGPNESFEIYNNLEKKKTIRGGSYLCHDDWCSGFRNARRMRNTPDTSMEHLGFRCVRSIKKR